MRGRVGIGYDVHRFAPGADRSLVIGGVVFEGEPGLLGHSDADVAAHAVADAMLGAAGLGDLGAHFPDSADEWRGANSVQLLAHVAELVASKGYQLANADCTVVGERPMIAPRRGEMMERLSDAAGGPVHVKATRPEGLGLLGSSEGLACMAVALLEELAHG